MPERARVLENVRAGVLGRGREAERVVERMQMPGVRVVESRDIAIGRERAAHFVPVHPVERVIAVAPLERFPLGAQLRLVSRLESDEHVAGRPVALDAMALNLGADEIDAFDGCVPDHPRGGHADQPLELLLTFRNAGQHLAAVTP
jgi:hypothetical protein